MRITSKNGVTSFEYRGNMMTMKGKYNENE